MGVSYWLPAPPAARSAITLAIESAGLHSVAACVVSAARERRGKQTRGITYSDGSHRSESGPSASGQETVEGKSGIASQSASEAPKDTVRRPVTTGSANRQISENLLEPV